MKKNIIYAASLLALTFGNISCSESFLELEPKTGQAEANYYKTEEQAFLAVTAVYDAYSVQNWQFAPTMSDIWSDDTFAGGSNVSDMSQWQEMEMFKMTSENNSSSDMWNRCYSGIYRANLYLQKQEEVEWVTDGLKDRLEAETLFFRAYFYWDLVRHYGYTPVITEVLPSVEDYKSLPQGTPEELFTQIATDLLNALPNLPVQIAASEKGRISKAAAQALIARIYLYHEGFAKPVMGVGSWSNGTTTIDKTYATAALESIITSGQYSLISDYADLWDWDNQNNAESILEIQYSEKAKSGDWGGWNINGNFSCVWVGPRNPNGDGGRVFPGWSFSVPTWSLGDEFETGDPRKDVTLYNADVQLSSYTHAFMNTGYFNNKYMALNAYIGSGGDNSHNFPRNFVDIRYADVLLMAAELNMDSNPTKALDYFNQVRTRAMGVTAEKTSITIDDIYHERRVEFGCEGLRKWDLLRRGNDYTAAKIAASFDIPSDASNANDFEARVFKAETWGMFPIPAADIRNTNDGALQQMVPAYK
ncbi:RagB/SusD family nutrient uptake outer membrane protein [Mangrovibacterium lignilyticum]|uniref:RagB/SusD family nutrient uptake outer membrane protein n=1 Tax=Mangrovibacterium lignilyticum TaxID=2668052 RepID=UPI0013D5F7C6|nr:RagB/SusD family nutrient uptake outer membrane protein [Mangrovibacterium lignilyticum]